MWLTLTLTLTLVKLTVEGHLNITSPLSEMDQGSSLIYLLQFIELHWGTINLQTMTQTPNIKHQTVKG